MTAKERILWTLGFLALVAAIVGAISLARMMGIEGRPESPLIGQAAPALVFGRVEGGEAVDLAALRGEVVVLDFWASWCGPCRHSIPALNDVHSRYQGRIQMFGVNVDHGLDTRGIARAHQSFGAQFPSVIDDRGQGQLAFEVTSIPSVILLDREGVVRYVRRGVPDPDEVADAIDDVL